MFWGLTPTLFGKLLDRHEARQRRADRRAGEIAAMTYNVNRDLKKDPKGWSWLDVFPEHRTPTPAMDDESMFEAMQRWAKVRPPDDN